MNKDAIKERLTTLRLYLTIVVTIDTACIAWFISNYKIYEKIILIFDLLVITILTGSLFYFIYEIKIKNNKLEDFND